MSKSLSQKIKEAGAHTLIYGIGGILQKALSFFLIPIYTKYYTTEMYGALALLSIVGLIGSSIFYFGVHSALSRSYFEYPEGKERKKVVTTTLTILIIGALTQIILGFIFKDWLSMLLFDSLEYSKHIVMVLSTTALGFITNLFYMLLRFDRKSKVVSLLNIIQLILTVPLILYLLINLKMDVMAPILTNLVVAIIMFLILFALTRKHFAWAINKKEVNIQLKWGLSIVVTNFGVLALNWIDRFFIKKYCSMSDVGIYSMGNNIGMMINIFLIGPFMQIWNPMRMEYRNDKNASVFYKKMTTYFLLFGLIIFSGLSIFSKDILTLMSSRPEYIQASSVIPWIAFSGLLVGMGNLTNHGIIFERKVHIGAYTSWGGAFINVILNIIFIPKYGYLAAAYTTLVSFLLIRIISIYISQKYYKQKYEIGKISFLVISSLFIVTLTLKLEFMILNKILIFTLLLLSYALILDKKEKKKIIQLLRK